VAFAHSQATTGSNNNANSTSLTINLPNNPTLGDLVVAGFTWANGAGTAPSTPTVVDSNSNAYTLSTKSPSSTQAAAAGFDYVFYLLSAPANASKTLKATYQDTGGGAVHAAILQADDFNVTGSISFFADAVGSGTTGGTINTPTISSNSAGDLLYCHATPANSISSVNSPWTQGVIDGDGQASGYILSASTGGTALNMTQVSGAWDSIALAFTISGPPIILSGPTDKTVDSGNSASFSVSASSQIGAILSYQWKENGTNIASATNASVTINPTLQTDQNGSLTVSVWDSNGTTNSGAGILRLNFNGGLYYLQEVNTSSRFTLEDGSGLYLMESWSTSAASGFIPPFYWGDLDGLGRRFFKDRLSG
jgi:hypothetical protein